MQVGRHKAPLDTGSSQPGWPPPRPSFGRRLLALLVTCRRRHRERQYLRLSDHRVQQELKAQGHDIVREAIKPAWRP